MDKRLILAISFGGVGCACAYTFHSLSTPQIIYETIRTLGNISAISGSLVGWSLGWVSQNRTLLRDITYTDRAEELFHDLGELQTEVIWSWAIVVACSLLAIFCAIMIKPPTNTGVSVDIQPKLLWVFSACISLVMAIGHLLCLFSQMVAVFKLRIKLENFEFEKLRKKRNLPEMKEELV